jgi:hypothetical protein
MSAMIFSLTKLALIYLNGLTRTANLLSAVLQVDEHGLSDSLFPVADRSGTEAMLLLDTNRRHVVNDVLC